MLTAAKVQVEAYSDVHGINSGRNGFLRRLSLESELTTKMAAVGSVWHRPFTATGCYR